MNYPAPLYSHPHSGAPFGAGHRDSRPEVAPPCTDRHEGTSLPQSDTRRGAARHRDTSARDATLPTTPQRLRRSTRISFSGDRWPSPVDRRSSVT